MQLSQTVTDSESVALCAPPAFVLYVKATTTMFAACTSLTLPSFGMHVVVASCHVCIRISTCPLLLCVVHAKHCCHLPPLWLHCCVPAARRCCADPLVCQPAPNGQKADQGALTYVFHSCPTDTAGHCCVCCVLCAVCCLCCPADTVLTNLNASLHPMGKNLIKIYSLVMLFYLTTGMK